MGVPSFFRWLLEKYPRVIVDVIEDEWSGNPDGTKKFADSSKANPNGTEFDNLYLDMNGIIHPCTHPESGPQPSTEDEMIRNVFEYIEHIFSIVRPRKVLYMAIDGVAPRAKMNQQRSRRFRAAEERKEHTQNRAMLEAWYRAKGIKPPPPKPPSWDSNVITPGTPFMDKLAKALRYWVKYKMHTDPGWKNIKVILSDANVPGEGEHKIAEFIRRTRIVRGYDPNTHHVLYGLDADLFMLSLATHEVHFTLLRELVLFGKNKPCQNCGVVGHWHTECTNPPKDGHKDMGPKPFQFAHIHTLREYLKEDLYVANLGWGKWDLERALDDFVFLCFFVGNDFLPHLPSLEIGEGGIDNLITSYKEFLPRVGGYLTDGSGRANLRRAELMLQELGRIEDQTFRQRKKTHDIIGERRKQRDKRNQDKRQRFMEEQRAKRKTRDFDLTETARLLERARKRQKTNDGEVKAMEMPSEFKDLQDQLGDVNIDINDDFMELDFEAQLKKINRAASDLSGRGDQAEHDAEFHKSGFKQRYYRRKFAVNSDDNPPLLHDIAHEYVKGLCWVLLYYYQGCPSWSWFFPFHYSPFASDLKKAHKFEIQFEASKPFEPYGQLMGVLPAVSGEKALPESYQRLMSDPNSPIIDFYPDDFKLDLNGKKYAWQAVALLPWVDAKRLTDAIEPLWDTLTPDQKRMNSIGFTELFVNCIHPLANSINELHVKFKDQPEEVIRENAEKINVIKSHGIGGYIESIADANLPGQTLKSLVEGLPDLEKCQVVCARYELPDFKPHVTSLLPGATPPKPILTELDFDHMRHGRRFGKPRGKRRPRDSHHNYHRGHGWGAGHAQGNKRARDEGLWNKDQSNRPEFGNWKQHEQRKRYGAQQFSRGGGWGHNPRGGGRGGGHNRGHRGGYQNHQSNNYRGGHQGGHRGGHRGGYQSHNRHDNRGYQNHQRSDNRGYQNNRQNRQPAHHNQQQNVTTPSWQQKDNEPKRQEQNQQKKKRRRGWG